LTKTLKRIEVSKVRAIPWLPYREQLGDLVSLAKSIAAKGDVDVPLKVRPTPDGSYELIWGKRRLEAAKLAGIERVTCIVEDMDDEEVLRQCVVENLHREDRNPLEEGELFHLLKVRTGKTYDEIARMLGLHPKYLYNRVELLKLPDPVKERLKSIPTDRKVGLSQLIHLMKVRDPRAQMELLTEVLEKGLSVDELKKRIAEITSKGDQSAVAMGRSTAYFDLTVPLNPEDVAPTNLSNLREVESRPRKVFTHFDTPSLFFAGGKTIDQYPLDWFIGKAVVVDVSKLETITVENVKESLVRHYLPPRMIVLFYTGWARKRGSDEYYEHPEISPELADWLVERRVKMIGVDMPNPERRPDRYVHKKLLSNDVLILENLDDMSPIAGRIVTLYAFPMRLRGSEVTPARVVARLRVRRRVPTKVEYRVP
jgi:ParB/RepB/Spo0J family partition protein